MMRLATTNNGFSTKGPAFRHGKSLGSGKNKDWSRVKFGAGRYRLFFRYSEKEKVIILGWMNG
ncbi:Toxin YhaV [Shigella sonnei]|nr:Toxin YhaV [Shigella sonnei]